MSSHLVVAGICYPDAQQRVIASVLEALERYGLYQCSRDAIVKDKPPDRTSASKRGGPLSESCEPARRELFHAGRVSLDGTQMLVEDKIVNLAPCMVVTVEIRTGSRRIIEYVMSPLLRYKQTGEFEGTMRETSEVAN